MRARTLAARLAATALLLLAGTAPALASTITGPIDYSVTGKIDDNLANPPLTFRGFSGQWTLENGVIPLGQFPLKATGQDVTYNNVGFTVDFTAPQFHKVVDASQSPTGITTQYDGQFELRGVINGTVTADGKSTLMGTINSISPTFSGVVRTADRVYLESFPFALSDVHYSNPVYLSMFSTGGGTFELSVTVVPEPGTVTIALVMAAAGVAWRWRESR